MTKRRLWIIPLVVLLHAACHDRSTEPVSTPGGIEGIDAKIPDLIIEKQGVLARFYNAGNPYAVTTLARTVTEPSVAQQLQRFEAHGYAYRPDHSFVTDGELDGRAVEIAALSMGHRSRQDAVMLFCIRDGDGLTVVPTRLSEDAALAEEGFHEIQKSVWFGPITPADNEFPDEAVHDGMRTEAYHDGLHRATSGSAPRMHQAQAAWGWNRWVSCLGSRVLAGFASCAVTCKLTMTGYFQCLTICTGGHAAYAFVYCSIRALNHE
jgi:hypothetical protein